MMSFEDFHNERQELQEFAEWRKSTQGDLNRWRALAKGRCPLCGSKVRPSDYHSSVPDNGGIAVGMGAG
jgi:hypothetical protein